jgi:nucleoside-diphosphate-sugar epimerase
METVLVTGGAGYIGSILVRELVKTGYRVVVLDRYFFGENGLDEIKNVTLKVADIRRIKPSHFDGIDIVIDLAGLSNDPTCDLDPDLTMSINYKGTVSVARIAAKAGVKRYILSSSCSVYGQGEGLLTEESPPKPLTRYAEAKLNAEQDILELVPKYPNTCFTILRNGTVFGLSHRMRFDLVVNIMTLHAFLNGRVYVMGTGQHWRPLIHIGDVARAFLIVAETDPKLINGQIFNVGDNELNYRVITIAYQVKSALPDTQIEMLNEDPERRDYRVSFDKIENIIGYRAKYSVQDGVKEIVDALRSGALLADDPRWYTLRYYQFLLQAERLYKKLNMDGSILV